MYSYNSGFPRLAFLSEAIFFDFNRFSMADLEGLLAFLFFRTVKAASRIPKNRWMTKSLFLC